MVRLPRPPCESWLNKSISKPTASENPCDLTLLSPLPDSQDTPSATLIAVLANPLTSLLRKPILTSCGQRGKPRSSCHSAADTATLRRASWRNSFVRVASCSHSRFRVWWRDMNIAVKPALPLANAQKGRAGNQRHQHACKQRNNQVGVQGLYVRCASKRCNSAGSAYIYLLNRPAQVPCAVPKHHNASASEVFSLIAAGTLLASPALASPVSFRPRLALYKVSWVAPVA